MKKQTTMCESHDLTLHGQGSPSRGLRRSNPVAATVRMLTAFEVVASDPWLRVKLQREKRTRGSHMCSRWHLHAQRFCNYASSLTRALQHACSLPPVTFRIVDEGRQHTRELMKPDGGFFATQVRRCETDFTERRGSRDLRPRCGEERVL